VGFFGLVPFLTGILSQPSKQDLSVSMSVLVRRRLRDLGRLCKPCRFAATSTFAGAIAIRQMKGLVRS